MVGSLSNLFPGACPYSHRFERVGTWPLIADQQRSPFPSREIYWHVILICEMVSSDLKASELKSAG